MIMIKSIAKLILALSISTLPVVTPAQQKPVRIGIAGLSHDHIHGLLGRKEKGDIVIVGIAEPDSELVERLAKRYGFDKKIVYSSIDEMLRSTKPEAVMAYNDIFGHLEVVEKCAPRGIHVMVEKPLAVSVAHADKMAKLAKKNNIQILTNYETTWYGSNTEAYKVVNEEEQIREIRKIEFHTGHQGPVEIGCSKEFLAWLTDPVLNGAGALNDFGCYGANLSTWLLKGETPVSITAVTHTNKPQIYPNVDDEASIIVQYPDKQVIIQASWNWPYNRKETKIYGQSGYVFCRDAENMTVLKSKENKATDKAAPALKEDRNDAFSYFARVVRGDINPQPYDLSALPNNEVVVKILELAKKSAESGKTIMWKEYFK